MGKKQRDPAKAARKIISHEKREANKGKFSQGQFNKFLSTMKEQGQTDEMMRYIQAMGKDVVAS